ncbi:MAG: hypothetical protein IKF52_04360 [Clostridia bacterium]|nr:hypothetical protein [Clostridia bacterium]
MSFIFNMFNKSGIVNVRMVITEEKILSNIEKIQKMINPNSKKQIVQLEEDSYFRDLIDSVKTYLLEYPKKKNFPVSVYKAAYDLVEFATNQFEENTRKIEELIIQREKNIGLAFELKDILKKTEETADGWQDVVDSSRDKFSDDIIDALNIIGNGTEDKDEIDAAVKLVQARIKNLESNFHIEIDMERIEDKSKALSFIGIEIAESLKYIPAPVEQYSQVEKSAPVQEVASLSKVENTAKNEVKKVQNVQPVQESIVDESYLEQTTFEVKPSLWQKIKNSRLVRTIRYIMKIRVVLDVPLLPEGRGENNL